MRKYIGIIKSIPATDPKPSKNLKHPHILPVMYPQVKLIVHIRIK
jgi:hypothetical protein